MNGIQKLVAGVVGAGVLTTGGVYLNNRIDQEGQERAALVQSLDDARGDFNAYKSQSVDDLGKAQTLIRQLKDEVTRVKDSADSQVTFNKIPDIVAGSKANTLMTFRGSGKWTSSLLRIENRLYVLSCAHAFKSPQHFLSNKLRFEAFDGSYKFEMTPVPFEDGSIGFFEGSTGMDISIFPLTKNALEQLPDMGRGLGVQLEDITKMPGHGSFIYTLGNSSPYSHSVHLGPVVHPGRTIPSNGTLLRHQVEHGPLDYGNSGGPQYNLLTGNQCGVVSWGPTFAEWKTSNGGPLRAFSVGAKGIKQELSNELGLPVFSEDERRLLALEEFLMPTPLNPTPLGNAVPKKQGKLTNVRILDAVKNFPILPLDPLGQAASIVVANHSAKLTEEDRERIRIQTLEAISPPRAKSKK